MLALLGRLVAWWQMLLQVAEGLGTACGWGLEMQVSVNVAASAAACIAAAHARASALAAKGKSSPPRLALPFACPTGPIGRHCRRAY